MLILLGATAVMVAGLALPLMFDDQDDADEDWSSEDWSPEEEAPLKRELSLLDELDLTDPDPDPSAEPDPITQDGEETSDAPDPDGATRPGSTSSASVVETEREGRPILEGSDTNEVIAIPPLALVQGGGGADTYLLSAESGIGEQAEILDFDAGTDRLVLIWDDASHAAPPKITLGQIEDAPDMRQVLANGVVIAHVEDQGLLERDRIELVPRSELPS